MSLTLHASRPFVLGFALSLFAGLSMAAALPATHTVGTLGAPWDVSVLAADNERTVLRFEVGSFATSEVKIDGESWSQVQWDGGALSIEAGAPALPSFHESILIPDDARMEITILDATFEERGGLRIAPSKGNFSRQIDPDTVPWTFGASYERNAFFPDRVASLGTPYLLRDARGAVVTVSPFQWNPQTETLRIWTRVDVEIKVVGAGERNVLTQHTARRAREFEDVYRDHFINYEGSRNALSYIPVAETGRMCVVAHDAFIDAIQPLVDWKNQMGIPTTLTALSAIGETPSAIKEFTQGHYDTDGITFLLLVGDSDRIPASTYAGGLADAMYVLLAGNDHYPDAFVGRISAQSVDQVETQVERAIAYERDPDVSGSWFTRALAIASDEGAGIGDEGEEDWEHARNYRADLLAFTFNNVGELFDGDHEPPPGPGHDPSGDDSGDPTPADVSAFVNLGCSFIGYTGHGYENGWTTTGFSNTHVNQLTNASELPFISTVACLNGQYHNRTCFAETWMRATHDGQPSGAIAIYASTISLSWAPPMRAQDEMIDLMVAGGQRAFGALCYNGSCEMLDHYGSAAVADFRSWTVFGDPSLRVRTAVPTALTVAHDGEFNAALATYTVTTAPEALVALSDGGVLIGSAFADESGVASVVCAPEDVEGLTELLLTVTGFNAIPFFDTVTVSGGATAVHDVVAAGRLGASRPNPFAEATTLTFSIDVAGAVHLDIYDVAGRHVRTLGGETLAAGNHQRAWDGRDGQGRQLPAGSYFARLKTADGATLATQKLIRVR